MNLFPINQPTLALSILKDTLHLVTVKKRWRTTILQHVNKVSLPAGLIRLSSATPNIENMDMFIEQLRMLTAPLNKPVSIAISLPDLCARTSMFDFSTFPAKASEQTALLRWRFQQDLKLDTLQSRLAFGIYIPTSLSKGAKHENPETAWVLGAAIRHEIVEQYEQACLDVNVMPVSVSLSGLDIFAVYQSTMQEVLEAEDQHKDTPSPGAMFLFISHWGFTFIAFHDGCPRFIRTKAIDIRPDSNPVQEHSSLSGEEFQDTASLHAAEQAGQELDSKKTHNEHSSTNIYPSSIVTKVEREILATLQYYLETFPHNHTASSPTHLFVVSDLEHGHTLLPPSDHLQQTAQVCGLHDSHIQVTQLLPTTHFTKREIGLAQESDIWPALSGYASIRVA